MDGKVVLAGERFFRDNETFAIIRFRELEKARYRLHTHDFVEICYVGAGTGCHVVGEREYRVAKGDLFLINYDMTHAFYRSDGDDELVTYNMLFKPAFFDDSLLPFNDFSSLTMSYLFRNCWGEEGLRADLRLTAEEQREFDALAAKLHREYEERQSGYGSIIRAYMIELIVKMMRGFSRIGADDVYQRRKAADIEEALRHLEAYYYEPVQLSELARKTFLSKNYFAQLFKEQTGLTVFGYIQQKRIDEACRLMRETNYKMVQIAQDVGYSDYKAFYLAFRRQRGMSPNEYMKSLT